MQLSEVLELAAREGVRRRVEKRAGVMLPLAVGAMIPGIVHKAMHRAHTTEQRLDQEPAPPYKMAALPLQLALPLAQLGQKIGPMFGSIGAAARSGVGSAGSALGKGAMGSLGALGGAAGGGVAQGISGGIGESIKRKLIGRDFGEKKDPFHLGATGAIGAFSKEIGTTGANLLRDIANKAMEAVGHAGDQSARDAIIGDLKRNDPVLAGADDTTLMEAYHTMSRFAPVLSTDKNAVRSFLRQAVTSGSGPDFMSIKLVADAERAVTGEKKATANLGELLMGLREAAPVVGRAALKGAVPGAIGGAILDEDNRADGAMRGALAGGALNALVKGVDHAKQVSHMDNVLGHSSNTMERVPFTSQYRPRYPGGLPDYLAAERRRRGL